jgi:hypothetical protein
MIDVIGSFLSPAPKKGQKSTGLETDPTNPTFLRKREQRFLFCWVTLNCRWYAHNSQKPQIC